MNTIRHLSGFPQRDSHSQVQMTSGKVVSEKFNRMTWCYEWTPRFWKFSKKSVLAFSSRNQIWKGTGGSEEDDLNHEEDSKSEWIYTLWVTRRCLSKRESRTHHEPKKKRYNVCMKNAWTCDMQKFKSIMDKNPIQTYQHSNNNNQSHI